LLGFAPKAIIFITNYLIKSDKIFREISEINEIKQFKIHKVRQKPI
jgi:hypothetical protein